MADFLQKRILYIIPTLEQGGAEYCTVRQINELHRQNYPVFLLVLSRSVPLLDQLDLPHDQIEVLDRAVPTFNARTLATAPLLVPRLLKLIQKWQIDCLLAVLPLAHFVARLAKINAWWGRSFKVIPYHRSLEYAVMGLNRRDKRLYHRASNALAYLADWKALFVSEAVRENIMAHLYTRHYAVIYNGILKQTVGDHLAKAYFKEKAIHKAPYIILFPGRLNAVKGQLFFLEAFQKLLTKHQLNPNDILLILVGDGDFRPKIEQQIQQLQLKEFVHITGFVFNELLLSFHKMADLVVIPSHFEALGNVALEGLMQQSLMLTSNAGGLNEIIQDGITGFKFEKDNGDALLEKLDFIYQNSQEQLIDKEKLKLIFEKKYSLAINVQNLLNLINNSSK